MSIEQAKAFIEKMKTDEAFREKIMAIESPEDRLKAIGAAGFECTGEGINEAAGTVEVSGGGFADAYQNPLQPSLCIVNSIQRSYSDLLHSTVERLTTPR